jgi:hypothetical protein
MFPGTDISGSTAMGAYMVPTGVTSINFIPITSWGDNIPAGGSIKLGNYLNGFLPGDMSSGAYGNVNYTYAVTPVLGYYDRAFLTELTMTSSVVAGEYLNLALQLLYPVTDIPAGFELMMHGWRAELS